MKKIVLLTCCSLALIAVGIQTIVADEPAAYCCAVSVPDCANTPFPQCNIVGADCDTLVPGVQGYCMKEKSD